MKRDVQNTDSREGGFVIFVMVIFTSLLIMSLAFAVDISRAHDQQRQIQIAADAASLAAAGALGQAGSYSSVLSTVTTIAQANGVAPSEVLYTPPRCGVWSNGSFTANSGTICDSSSTAVEVSIHRAMPTTFGRFFHLNQFALQARSIGYLPPPTGGSCIRPFGIESSHLTRLNVPVGGTVTVSGTQGAGNWGKLDIGGNSSSGTQYTNLMFNNVCHNSVAAGNSISAGTGNAQIDQVFQALLNDTTPPLGARNMVIAVTSDFGSGNCSVDIQRFMRVDLLSQSGNGARWQATFRVVELDATPDPPSQPTRQLMQ